MPVSNSKRISIKKYQQEKRDRLTVDVPKGKRDEYKAKAGQLGLSLSMLIQNGVEAYGENSGEVITPTQGEKLTSDQKRLLDEFGKMPVEVQKQTLKLIREINGASVDAAKPLDAQQDTPTSEG